MVPDETPDATASLVGAIIGIAIVLLFTGVLVTIGFNEGVIPAAQALGVETADTINVLQGLFVSVFFYSVFGRHTLNLTKS